MDRLSVVFRHRLVATTSFLLTVIVMMLQSYSMIPMYKAQARLLIEDERSTMIMDLDANNPIFWADDRRREIFLWFLAVVEHV